MMYCYKVYENGIPVAICPNRPIAVQVSKLFNNSVITRDTIEDEWFDYCYNSSMTVESIKDGTWFDQE